MPWLNTLPWWVFAIAGAVFAGATNVFIKAGMKGVHPDLATAARTTLAVPIVWCIAAFSAPRVSELAQWTARNWLFISLSAFASGLSWLCMYKSIYLSSVTKTLPIDKTSIAFGFLLAVIFLRERPNWQSTVATLLILAALAITLIPDKSSPAPVLPQTAPSATR